MPDVTDDRALCSILQLHLFLRQRACTCQNSLFLHAPFYQVALPLLIHTTKLCKTTLRASLCYARMQTYSHISMVSEQAVAALTGQYWVLEPLTSQ
jgi:hypothetical protein